MSPKKDLNQKKGNVINIEEALLTKNTSEQIKSVQEGLFQYEGDEFVNWQEAVESVLGKKLPDMDLIYKRKQDVLNDILDMLPDGDASDEVTELDGNDELSEEDNKDDTTQNETLNNIIDLVNYKKTQTLKKKRKDIPLCEQVLLWGNDQPLSDIEISLLLTDIRRGFEAGELLYLYQPQWDLQTGKIVALESFLHWNHPTKGVLGPDYLVSVFEKSGLLPDLTVLLFEQLIYETKKHRDMGLPHVKMMFNIVPEQMEIEGLSNVLLSVVYDNNLKPDDFECVFCNTKSTQKPQVIHQNIQELQEDGFSLCLNNFGVGYSSYPYIKSFVFDKIKIDKSYLYEMSNHPRTQLLVQSFIRQAHLFGSCAVADGIREKEIIKTLRLWNCDYGQGSCLNSPISSKEMIDFLKEYAKIEDKGIKAIEEFWQKNICSNHSNGYGCNSLKTKDK